MTGNLKPRNYTNDREYENQEQQQSEMTRKFLTWMRISRHSSPKISNDERVCLLMPNNTTKGRYKSSKYRIY